MLTGNGYVLHDGSPVPIPADLASRFSEGDRLFVSSDGGLLHVPRATEALVVSAVARARSAFSTLQTVEDRQITQFFVEARSLILQPAIQKMLKDINEADCRLAEQSGRSITRLRIDERMLSDMVESLALWEDHPVIRQREVERTVHEGWSATQWRTPLGVVGFVFEGRPNVVVDACGVLVTGNTCVFRIGRDARGTARALLATVIVPALRRAGLPEDSLVLIESDEHASGWSLFAQRELGLAVARGSGKAVQDLGSVARQSGVPVSLHGRGGAWFIVGGSADAEWLGAVLINSLDRKVCNTANVVCVPRERAAELSSVVVSSLAEAARRRLAVGCLHLVSGDTAVPPQNDRVTVIPADHDILAKEWEWENDPEITMCVVDSFDEAIRLFNEYSPRLVASVITSDSAELERAWTSLECPFFGDGMSRWVDGQYAFDRPELGLSNWELGVPLGRGAILSGPDISRVRYRASQTDQDLCR